jgi:hypothetical protein
MPLFGWRGNMVGFLMDPIRYMMRLYQDHARNSGGVAAFIDGDNKHLLFTRKETPPSRRTFFAFSPEANPTSSPTRTCSRAAPSPGPRPTPSRISRAATSSPRSAITTGSSGV